MPNAQFIPGQPGTPPGWDLDGDGMPDIPLMPGPMHRPKPPHKKQIRTQEIKQLNQYQGYFTTPDGDFPVTVVANSIKEAAKILTMPGVFGNNVTEPTTIKFLKGQVAVSVPVHHVGFNTVIEPAGASESGAYATPAHAEVHNGTEVIFTAYEPFGWKFLGWYKGDQCLSTDLIAYIEVYDPYSTLVEYVAKYEFDPTLRNGRYISLGSGLTFDFKFDGWGSNDGRCILNSDNAGDYFFIMPPDTLDIAKREIILRRDTSVTQTEPEEGLTMRFEPTAIGINLQIINTNVSSRFGFTAEQIIPLRWIFDPVSKNFNGSL
jgi:hypothetical protein